MAILYREKVSATMLFPKFRCSVATQKQIQSAKATEQHCSTNMSATESSLTPCKCSVLASPALHSQCWSLAATHWSALVFLVHAAMPHRGTPLPEANCCALVPWTAKTVGSHAPLRKTYKDNLLLPKDHSRILTLHDTSVHMAASHSSQ